MTKVVFLILLMSIGACRPTYETIPLMQRVDSLPFNQAPYADFQAKLSCAYQESFKEKVIQTNDSCRLYTRQMGEGDPILFIHGGWGHELSPLYSTFRKLQANHKVIFYDQRGSLRSFCQNPEVISVSNHVKDLETIRKNLGLDSFSIIAHSMGGYLAMKYLQQHGDEHLNQVIMLSTLPPKFELGKFNQYSEQARSRWERPATKKLLNKYGLEPELKAEYSQKESAIWQRITFASINLHNLDRWNWFKGAFSYNRIAGMQTNFSMERGFKCPDFFPIAVNLVCLKIDDWLFRSFDFRPTLAETDVPVTFIHADDDFIPVSIHTDVIKEAPNYTLKVVKDAGHVMWVDQPEVVTELIPDLLKN